MKKLLSFLFGAVCLIATPVIAATLTVQNMSLSGLQYASTFASASASGDVFTNDGRTFMLITNTSAGSYTATFDAVATISKPGFGTITLSDTVVTVPGSGTNDGRVLVGPFPQGRFNNSAGRVSVTYDDNTYLNVNVVRMPNY